MNNKLDNSRELDVWIWSNKPEVKEATNFIFSKMKKILPSGYTEKNIKKHLRVILTDLFVAHKKNPKLYISFSRDVKAYKASKIFSKIYLNYRYVVIVTEYLNDNGYINYKKGVNFLKFKRMSRMKATDKLIRLFRKYRSDSGVILKRNPPIFLRDSEKRDIDFDLDTIEIKTLIRNTNRINKNLENHSITFNPPVDFSDDYSRVYSLMVDNTKYYRVFNNGSFEQGGRFYGHWSQMIDSDWRKYIEIDGHSTVELDYSCLHLSMLYGLENQTPPEGDLYKLAGINDAFRKIIKKSVNIAINGDSESVVIKAMRQEYYPFIDEVGLIPDRPQTLLNAIKWNHLTIEKYFCSGYGVHLQYLDSCIAENIMITLNSRDICCLCIHDSFIVADKYKIVLHDIMMQSFYDKFNFYPRINAK
ncbi:MAG: hypothetical protein IJD16_00635 [Desulfovibrio sp.]|nr:hypothetical protein [Desulfovibrio sp.]